MMAGTVAYSACQWLILVVLARLGSPVVVGEFGLAAAITAPVVMFTNLGLNQLLATDGAQERPFRTYRDLRLVMTIVAMAAIIGIALAMGLSAATFAVVAMVGMAKAVEAVSDIHFGLLQQRQRMDRVAISQTVKGVFSVVVVAGVMAATGRLDAAMAAMAVVWLTVLLAYDVRAARITGARFESDAPPGRLTALARSAAPLGLAAAFTSLSVMMPRYFLEYAAGRHELGLFTALAYLLVAARLALHPLNTAIAPRLGQAAARGDWHAFDKLLRLSLFGATVLALLGVLLAVVAGRQLLALIYGPEYASQSSVLIPLMAAAGLGNAAVLCQSGLVSLRRLSAQLTAIVASLATVAIGCTFLIPGFGVWGAAVAIALGAAVELGATMLALFRARAFAQTKSSGATVTPVAEPAVR